jgi:arginine-tRNA-protein transferase
MRVSSPEERAEQARRLERAIVQSGITPGDPHPCAYLPGREARNLTILPTPVVPGVYRALLELNFRRMGPYFYRPQCDGCRQCRGIRVPIASFEPSRSQRRCRAGNTDVEVRVSSPAPTRAKHALYRRYLERCHDGQMSGSWEEYEAFLYGSPVPGLELEYRVGGRLLAVGIADLEPGAMSAVYCWYDPDSDRRGLGTFNVLRMIDECRARRLAHLYLGYFVEGCPKMSYKRRFRPHEILGADGEWRVC